MDSNELRRTFLRFFEERDHLVRPSASLIPHEPSLLVRADPDRLGQVFANLLSNARKFTAEGGARVSLRRLGPELARLGREAIAVQVADSGSGIPEEHLARVLAQGDRRPMKDNPGAMEELRALLAAREPADGAAAITLETSDRDPDEVVADLVERLAS